MRLSFASVSGRNRPIDLAPQVIAGSDPPPEIFTDCPIWFKAVLVYSAILEDIEDHRRMPPFVPGGISIAVGKLLDPDAGEIWIGRIPVDPPASSPIGDRRIGPGLRDALSHAHGNEENSQQQQTTAGHREDPRCAPGAAVIHATASTLPSISCRSWLPLQPISVVWFGFCFDTFPGDTKLPTRASAPLVRPVRSPATSLVVVLLVSKKPCRRFLR
jgi:hypothetical protein